MNKYKVDNLSAKTSKPDQSKLVEALRGVPGVKSATLHLTSHEFSVEAVAQQMIKREDITAAASKAGFTVAES